MTDLQRFLEQHGDALVQIDKPVPLDHVGALTGQTDETVVFNHIDGFPGWRLVDHLFVNRAAQAPRSRLRSDRGRANARGSVEARAETAARSRRRPMP